jgi:hypothetical protein|tara:strand:+ start:580 stop:951 length:372 start_codon:yes stop_codon:yes gene_type:complete
MGDRKCAFEDCNKLEFRTAGYCLNHTDNSLDGNQIEIPNTLQQRNLMEPPNIMLRIGIITIISAGIAFWPILLFEFGDPGGAGGQGAYIAVFFVTIPAALVIFLIGLFSSIMSYRKSLEQYRD